MNQTDVPIWEKYTLTIGVIELRRTLHHYLSEKCFA